MYSSDFLRQLKSSLFRAMENNSKDLMKISEDFCSIVQKYAIVTLYEKNEYRAHGSMVPIGYYLEFIYA
jgi:hypothetical protein